MLDEPCYRYELILCRPSECGDGIEIDSDRLRQAFFTLEAAWDHREIRVRLVYAAEEAANIIVQAEAS